MSDKDTTRRQFLAVAGSTTALALAGCASGGDGGDGSTDTDAMEMTDTDAMGGEATATDTTGGEMTRTDTTGGGMTSPATVTVSVENVAPRDFYGSDTSTGGQVWITPGAYAVHTGENPLFTAGEAASVGLEALAEAGRPSGFTNDPGLVGELQGTMGDMGVVSAGAFTPPDTVADPNDPKGTTPGAPPIAPGGAFEFEVRAEPGQRLSFASMFVPSNDLFFSPGAEGITLWPEGDQPVRGDVTDRVELWDAGTEPNAEPPGRGPDQAPAQTSPDQGEDEGGVIRTVDSLMDSYEYPAVSDAIRVTLSPAGSMDG